MSHASSCRKVRICVRLPPCNMDPFPQSERRTVQGVWKPALIPNPKYYKDDTPLAHIGKINAVAIEIWTMDSGFYFDDIVVANDAEVAAEFREKTYGPKKAAEVRSRPQSGRRPCVDFCTPAPTRGASHGHRSQFWPVACAAVY